MGSGPPVTVPGREEGDAERCLGSIAERTFRYAVCTCEDTNALTSRFTTRSLDSDAGGESIDSGAPVGVNGVFDSTGGLDIGGSLSMAGEAALELTGSDARIGGDLRTPRTLGFTGAASIARDAWVGGDVDGVGSLSIGRDLHQPDGASTSFGVTVERDTVREPVSVDDPCPCEPSDILDISAIVAAAETDNHNDGVDLAPDAYVSLTGNNRLELPCGRFYLEGIGGTGDLTLVVNGRTALFVDGDVSSLGELQVELGPDGELDLLVAGNLDATGSVGFGSTDRPAATRVYVGGSEGIDLTTSSGVFVGNVYAPAAPATVTGTTEVYGSVFAQSLQATGDVVIHYDRAILDAGEDCDEPPPDECTGCGDCSDGTRCDSGGMCLPDCSGDADCCEPFTCSSGSCEPILI